MARQRQPQQLELTGETDLDRVIEQTERAYAIAADYAALTTPNALARSIRLARAIGALRQAITPEILEHFLALAGSPLGFLCDRPNSKNPAPYSADQVKECLIEAMLREAAPIGNEWNIIAGRCYLTLAYYERRLREYPGVTDVRPVPGMPDMSAGNVARVRFGLSWKLNGEPNCLKDAEGKPGVVFSIRVNAGMGEDAVIGKASRKAYKMALGMIAGHNLPLPADDPDELPFQEFVPKDRTPAKPGKTLDSLKDDLEPLDKLPEQPTQVEPEPPSQETAADFWSQRALNSHGDFEGR